MLGTLALESRALWLTGLIQHQQNMKDKEQAMASERQVAAAKRNVGGAAAAAKSKRSIAHMPPSTRRALGRQGSAVARRKRTGPSRPKTRAELYEEAKRRDLPGRSKMGRAELARALGAA
jgi:hypothetical protein